MAFRVFRHGRMKIPTRSAQSCSRSNDPFRRRDQKIGSVEPARCGACHIEFVRQRISHEIAATEIERYFYCRPLRSFLISPREAKRQGSSFDAVGLELRVSVGENNWTPPGDGLELTGREVGLRGHGN